MINHIPSKNRQLIPPTDDVYFLSLDQIERLSIFRNVSHICVHNVFLACSDFSFENAGQEQ